MTEALTPCGDCAVEPGQPHAKGCDVARCLYSGHQRLSCGGRHQDMGLAGPPYQLGVAPCGLDVWTGRWPGDVECAEFGFWSYWDDSKGWVRCAPDHPQASEDLNRLHWEAVWDRNRGRWVLPKGVRR